MANFIHFENSHVFSKAPVQENMPASESVNKSVHTVQAEEIWANKCPFITYNEVKDLTSDKIFDNFEGYAPVKFNYKKQVIVLTDINNNGKDSNGLAGKVFIEGKPINQFISETDATDKNGALAFGYRPILFDKDGGAVPSDNYTVNCSNGIIYFTNPVESTAENCNYFLSFFTYEGAKLDTTITNIKDSIDQNKEELSGEIDKVETNLSKDISDHANDPDIHVSEEDRELWDKGGNMTITGDIFITPEKTDTGWNLTLNNSTVISSSITDGDKKVPTVNAVKNYTDNLIDANETNIESLDERVTIIEGTTNFNTLETQPSETTQWIAMAFNVTEDINDIINKKIRGITIKVTNTVSTPQFLAVFDTRTAGTKKLLGVSKGTTWNANETAIFKFNSPIIIPGSFEIFLLDEPVSTDLSGDPTKPSYYIESYSVSGNQTYRNIEDKWNSPRRSFYLTFNIVGDRMTTVEEIIGAHLEDDERHITTDERDKWNGILNDMLYDISYLHSNTNDVASVENRILTTTSNETVEIPMRKITHAKYAFRTKINTTSPLNQFNLRIVDGGKPGSGYDSAYYYERDVRSNSYDEDIGGNLETLGNLINGDGMFIRSGITTFNDDLACLTRARQMFTNSKLDSFRSALPSLTFADRMFLGTKLTEFKVKLPNLSSAECMFRLCENLKFVDTCFPNLTFAQGMFGLCNNLERVDLSASSGSNLYLADDMFAGCEKLKTIKINLSYLENAKNMFGPANNKVASLLDIESVKYIADTIKDWNNDYYSNRIHELALGIDLIHADYEASSYKQYIDQIADKNWRVTVYTSDSRNNLAFIVVK